MNDLDADTLRPVAKRVGPVIALAAFLAYLATLSPSFYPGASANHLAYHLGIMPFPAMSNILWGWCVQFLALLPLGPLDVRMNVFSALCAAGVVWQLYALVLHIRPDRRREPPTFRTPVTPVQIFSASMAALYLAACIPFWVAATRAHPLAFDLLLGLIPFRLLQRAASRDGNGSIYLAAFVYGLGVTEYATMMALGPLLALFMLVVLLRQRRFTVGVAVGIVAALLLGLTPYLLAASIYQQSPAYVWREFAHYGQVLKFTWLEQWMTLTRSLPRVGWLTMGVLTFLPWAIAFGYRLVPRPGSSSARIGQSVVHALVGLVLLAVLLDAPLSPWRTTRGEPMVIVPYVFAAVGMGFVCAFFMELAGRRRHGRNELAASGYAVGAVLLLFPLAAAIYHLPVTNGRSGAVAARHAATVLESLGSRGWLLTDGDSDAMLALTAKKAGREVVFINPRVSHAEAYQNFLASLFDDARLQGLVRVGLAPALQEWFQRPGVVERVGVMGAADLWEALGYEGMPRGLIYAGLRADEAVDADSVLAEYRAVADGYGAALRHAAGNDLRSPAAARYKGALNEMARLANNLGVFLEDHERPDEAAALYRESLVFDSSNLSALINLNVLSRRVTLPDAEELAARLEERVEAETGNYTLWSLSRIHGYVRTPEVFAGRGWAWAMSGKPGMAVREIKRAIRSGGDSSAAQLALAQMYFAEESNEQSGDTYRKLLAVNPEHPQALLGLSRLAARQGDFDEARRGIQRLRQLDVNADVLQLEEAVIEAMAGDLAKASRLLADLAKRQPDDARVWVSIAMVAMQQGDARQSDLALSKLQGMKSLAPPLRLALARMALSRRDPVAARRLLEDVLRAQPSNADALRLMVHIAQAGGDRQQVEQMVNRLLTAKPSDAYGNFLLGTFQYTREQYALAEASFRASLASQRTAETLNALAYIRVLRGALDEAETLVLEALDMDGSLANAWDTLANVYLRRGNLPEAEKALQKALAVQPDNASIRTTLARLHVARGREDDAVKLADELLDEAALLSPSDAQDLRAMLKKIRGAAAGDT